MSIRTRGRRIGWAIHRDAYRPSRISNHRSVLRWRARNRPLLVAGNRDLVRLEEVDLPRYAALKFSTADSVALIEAELTDDGDAIIALYREYADELKRVREAQRRFCSDVKEPQLETLLKQFFPVGTDPVDPWGGWVWLLFELGWEALRPSKAYMFPKFDDLDCEITYLLVRHLKPKTIVEISPSGGWSTSWLLRAVTENDSGTVYSYDLRDVASRLLPKELTAGRWVFSKGDVRDATSRIPSPIDYLFLDALHTGGFARWYVENLFPRLSRNAVVTVDDMFNPHDTLSTRKSRGPGGDTEPDVVFDWLTERKQPYFTVAPQGAPKTFEKIMRLRQELGILRKIRPSERNPAVFFRLRDS